MPNVKISQLPAGSAPTGVELLPAVQSAQTVSLTVAQIIALGQGGFFGTDSGTANAYIVTTARPIGLAVGQLVAFSPVHPNTGPSTLNVNGGGAAAVVNQQGNALTGGELSVPVWVMWTGSQWQIFFGSITIDKARTALETSAGVVPVNYNYAPYTLPRYMSATQLADWTSNAGTVDQGSAFAALFSISGAGAYIPAGSYAISSHTPLVPRCASIIGVGSLTFAGTVLKPQAGVTKLLSITSGGGNYPAIISGIGIDGTNTTNATGIVFGDSGAIHGNFSNITIGNFTGGSGVGMRVGDCIQCVFASIYCFNSDTPLVQTGFTGSPVAFPTISKYICCEFDLSPTGVGALVTTGYDIDFDGCVFQSNKQEGLKIIPASGAYCKGITVRKAWYENNWVGNVGGHFDVTVDGSNTPVNCSVYFDEPLWNSGASTALCINVTGALADVTINHPNFAAAIANSIVYQNGGFGRITNWDNFWSYTTIVSDALGKVIGWDGPLISGSSWSPTITIVGGSASLSGITINMARWRRVGVNLLLLEWNFTATNAGVNGAYLQIPIPAGFTLQGTFVRLPALATDNNVELPAAVFTDGAGNLRIYKANSAVYVAGPCGSTGQILAEISG